MSDLFEWFAGWAIETIDSAIDSVVETLKDLWSDLTGFLRGIAQKIINSVSKWLQPLIGEVRALVTDGHTWAGVTESQSKSLTLKQLAKETDALEFLKKLAKKNEAISHVVPMTAQERKAWMESPASEKIVLVTGDESDGE